MNYREEIIKMIDKIDHEHVIQFFYALLRVVTSDPDRYEESFALLGNLFSE